MTSQKSSPAPLTGTDRLWPFPGRLTVVGLVAGITLGGFSVAQPFQPTTNEHESASGSNAEQTAENPSPATGAP